jgi:hypothetical protein
MESRVSHAMIGVGCHESPSSHSVLAHAAQSSISTSVPLDAGAPNPHRSMHVNQRGSLALDFKSLSKWARAQCRLITLFQPM